eukprot:scaffold252020_cov28-Tisochrysis_lutea.AAC.2
MPQEGCKRVLCDTLQQGARRPISIVEQVAQRGETIQAFAALMSAPQRNPHIAQEKREIYRRTVARGGSLCEASGLVASGCWTLRRGLVRYVV